jgi:hypothetical protein
MASCEQESAALERVLMEDSQSGLEKECQVRLRENRTTSDKRTR